jgi:ankyrin repeat protein
MSHNTRENVNVMKSFLRNRNIKSISDLIKNKKINVNAPLNGAGHPTLFHYIYMILTQHEKTIEHKEFEIVKLIIKGKANINYINNGFNVLTMMCNSKRNIDEKENIIKLLLHNKADNYHPLLKHSALSHAVKSDCWRSVKLLLKHGVIPDETILTEHINRLGYYNASITKLLYEYSPFDILFKVMDNSQYTIVSLLYGACNMGCLNAVRKLIECDIYSVCSDVCEKISLFITYNLIENTSMLEIVMLNIKTIKTSNDQTRKSILGDGKDLNNYIEIAKLLIDYGAYTIKIKSNEIISSHANKRKNIIDEQLLLYFPKVLVNLIIGY